MTVNLYMWLNLSGGSSIEWQVAMECWSCSLMPRLKKKGIVYIYISKEGSMYIFGKLYLKKNIKKKIFH
jgi:hypothetical protein